VKRLLFARGGYEWKVDDDDDNSRELYIGISINFKRTTISLFFPRVELSEFEENLTDRVFGRGMKL
jgi:hypothetical protein